MAIRLADYYRRHLRRVKWVCASMLLAINITLAILLIYSGSSWVGLMVYILFPVVFLQIFAIIIILRYAMEPLAIMSAAIANISHETNDVKPPRINEPRHVRSGLKSMVQTIYEHATLTQKSTTQNTANPTTKLLDQFPCGVIGLKSGRVDFANSLAPLSTDGKGAKNIDLLFEQTDNLRSWLQSCETDKVADTHAWPRVANKPLGEPGRKIYDVVGHYQKDASIDTIVLCVDRTEQYAVNDEAMDFIALAAHELRGPITVIRGYLDVLEDELQPDLSKDHLQLFDRLRVSATKLSSYINNILNVSRYDRKHLKLRLHEDSLASIYAMVADDLALRASTQNRLLSIDIPNDLPTIAADRASLGEVLTNLIDNAIKYSRDGGHIVVTAKPDGSFVTCSIQDNGIGIPGSLVGNLFNKFYRSHRSSGDVGGTGLGLYLSKAIVESHGGRVGVRSTEGRGSTFTFSIPTYASVADKILTDNQGIISSPSGWIKNHSMFRG